MKLYVTVEEFLYAKKIENQTERTLRGYKNALNLFANWLQKEWTIDELEKIRVVHLKQYVAYHLKMGHKATYVNGIIKILRACREIELAVRLTAFLHAIVDEVLEKSFLIVTECSGQIRIVFHIVLVVINRSVLD